MISSNFKNYSFIIKYKNNKLNHYLQALPFYSNTRTCDQNTYIKHNIHHPIGKHDLLNTVSALIYFKN